MNSIIDIIQAVNELYFNKYTDILVDKLIIVEEEAPVIVELELDSTESEVISMEDFDIDTEEEDEEAQIKRRLAEIRKRKATEKVSKIIVELRATHKTYKQRQIDRAEEELTKAEEELTKLKQQLADVDTGVFDKELIAKALHELQKAPIKVEGMYVKKNSGVAGEGMYVKKNSGVAGEGMYVKKNAGVAGEGENRARAVRKLNVDDSNEKKRLTAFTKYVGEYCWGMHSNGAITAKDKQGVYSQPLWKDIITMLDKDSITVLTEVGQNSIRNSKVFKEWILENNKTY
jgi:hypothetical protein